MASKRNNKSRSSTSTSATPPTFPIDPVLIAPSPSAAPSSDAPESTDEPTTAVWEAEHEAFLIKFIFERRHKMSGGGFPKAVWVEAANALKKEFPNAKGLDKTHEKCKSKYQKLKGDYKIVMKLRESSGFGWDVDQCIVTATEDVWTPYLKAHPKAKQWKKTPFPLYNDMAILNGDVMATGRGAIRLGAAAADDAEPTTTTGDGGSGGEDDDNDDPPVPSKRKATDELDAAAGKKKARQKRVSSTDSIFAMSESIGSVASALARSFDGPSSGLDTSPVRRTRAIKMVQADGALEGDDMLTAIDLFEENTKKADTFLALDSKPTRVRWLGKQLGLS